VESGFSTRIANVVKGAFGAGDVEVRLERKPIPEERLPGRRQASYTIAIGSDHRGFILKRQLKEYLIELGHSVLDCGVESGETGDYPDIALSVAEKVARKVCDFGILIDMVGVGSAIAANKIKGIRAATCHNVESAKSSRAHNDANILVLGSSFVNRGLARRMVKVWLETPFEGGRHAKRVEKIARIEREGLDARL